MLGRVVIPDDPPYVLTLDDDRRWSTPDPDNRPVADGLDLAHVGTWGEWAGAVGAWQLADAADRLGGIVIRSGT